jgi:hypothetical protein
MTTLLRNLAPMIVVGIIVLGLASTGHAQYPGQRRLNHPPKIMRYEWAADEFVYRSSVLTPHKEGRLAGDRGYYGNRLTQFLFIGPPEKAGIYGSMREYKFKTGRDPAKHQYRWER